MKIRQLRRGCRGVHVTFSVSPVRVVFPRRQRRSSGEREREQVSREDIPRTVIVISRKPVHGAEEPIVRLSAARRGAWRRSGARSSSIFSATQVNPGVRPYSRSRGEPRGSRLEIRRGIYSRNDAGDDKGGELISASVLNPNRPRIPVSRRPCPSRNAERCRFTTQSRRRITESRRDTRRIRNEAGGNAEEASRRL